ncbi:hypothetical protein ACWDUN_20035 [Mycobacterium sp. NPDC003323]
MIVRSLPLVAALTIAAAAPAHAAPLPAFCGHGDICQTRLTSVTADVVDGTITGTPVGGGPALTLAGQQDAYLKSTGFTEAPEAVRTWDTTIDQVRPLDVSPSDPNWYGNAKAKVFLPRTLNGLATQFPPDTLVVSFTAADGDGPYRLLSIQPAAAF